MKRAALTAVSLLAVLYSAPAAGETIFADVPAWASPVEDTRQLALGDVDGDGDLDLVRASINQETTLYLNVGGVFDDVAAWRGPVEVTRSVALGDIDGDGDLDLVRGNSGQGATLYLNNGGLFGAAPVWSGQPEVTRAIALGDVDGDGDLDLVRGNLNQGTTIYLNTGGRFEDTPAWTGPAASTNAVALGDVNQDGRLDLVLGNFLQPSTLFLNDGTLFPVTPDWSGPAERTRGIALGDVDGDGDLDLVRGNLGAGATLTLNTNGSFEAAPAWTAPAESTWAVALGDVDDDGRLDLVRGNSERGTTLYLNTGGTFADTPFWVGPVQDNRSVALGDVDGDGDLDLLRGNLDQATTLHLNLAGALSPQIAWIGRPEETHALAVGDVDGDGTPDVVRGNLGGETTLYLNRAGVLDTVPAWTGPIENTLAVALGDVDGDGDLDLVRGNFDQGATLYRNEGGIFELAPSWSGLTETTVSIALGDIDEDGDLDLVRGNIDQMATLYLNSGGTFAATPAWTGRVESTRDVALGDVDGDGDLDLVRGNRDQGATLYRNEGGTFEPTPAWTGPVERTVSIALGDVDGNGMLDLVRGNLDQSATLTLNRGGAFDPNPVWAGPVERTASVALGDLDGDGDLDLVRGNVDGPSTIYLNDGDVFGALPAASVGGDSTWSAVLADLDGDGDLDGLLGKLEVHANRSPWLRGAEPSRLLPHHPAHLRWVAADAGLPNEYRITFQAADAEGDPLWMTGEYQFEGAATRTPMTFGGGASVAGPFATSPGGIGHEVIWDVTQMPFDERSIIIHLHAFSTPLKVSHIAFEPTYVHEVGKIVPVRPSLSASPEVLVFPTLTVGDSATVPIVIANRGNRDLVIEAFESPAPEIEVLARAGLTIAPDSEAVVNVLLAPRGIPDVSGPIRITANDPANPQVELGVTVDVRELEFETQLLAVAPQLPLGEAATVIVTPGPQVRIEGGDLFYGPQGATAFADSTRLVPQGSNFIALVPSEAVTEAGLRYFVRVDNSGVVRTDPLGAPDSAFFYPVASPAGAEANAVPGARGLFIEGSAIPIVVSLPQGSVFEEGAVYFAPGGSAEFDSVALELTEVTPGIVAPAALLPEDVAGPRGIDYGVRVKTLTKVLVDPPGAPARAPKVVRVTVGSIGESATYPADRYRLISIPLDLELPPTSSLESILSDQPEFGPADVTRWRAFGFDAAAAEYLEVTADASDSRLRPRPGRAFWLIAANPNAIDTAPVPGLSTATGVAYRITLRAGWNLIGNPFYFPVAWSDVSAVGTSGPVTLEPPVAWDENGNRYADADVDVLVPFAGYWLWNPEAGIVDLDVPPIEAVVPRVETIAPASTKTRGPVLADPASWQVRLSVSAAEYTDRRNVAGVAVGAAEGADVLDRTDPPLSPAGGVSLYFVDGLGETRTLKTIDLRSPIDPDERPEARGRRWVFDLVRSDGAAALDARLTLTGLDQVPSEYDVRLVDRERSRRFDVRSQAEVEFVVGRKPPVASADEARFELLVGTPAFLDAALSGSATRPAQTRLLPSFPNPIVSSATIRFEIAQSGPARLDVFDIAGRRVRSLVRGNLPAGVHEVSWAGRDEFGRRLAPGVYRLRLHAAGRDDGMPIVLVR